MVTLLGRQRRLEVDFLWRRGLSLGFHFSHGFLLWRPGASVLFFIIGSGATYRPFVLFFGVNPFYSTKAPWLTHIVKIG
jgi:hypothetical protein